jgi:UDP-N-acetylmuramate: L-alanyl-gamma-D-glutamyl-meso-diaminopimelate ligase
MSQQKVYKRHGSLLDLKKNAHVHLMGICGTAMASLAGLLKEQGFYVTGSDSNPYPPMSTQLESLGIRIQKPYDRKNLNPRPDFVIVGNVISANNPEAAELMDLKIPFCSLPEAMGEFIIADRDCYVISGTHGKTTTTSIMSWIAEMSNLNPGFLIGGIPKNFSKSFRNPTANTFIIEGDEYDTAFFDKVPKFIHYRPKNVILTSVEFDHADIYKDFQAVKDAFSTLMKLIPEDGNLVFWGDDENVQSISLKCPIKNKFSYGFNVSSDFRCEIVEESEGLTRFLVAHENSQLGVFVTTLTGKYNILNATAAIAMSYLVKLPFEGVQKAISTFTGVKRRQEVLGEPGGILIIEDFAHHPSAVKQTIEAIQNKYKTRKVFSVFEPRSATSRRKVFQKDYVEAFSKAHEVLLAEAFNSTALDAENRFSSAELIADLNEQGTQAAAFISADEIVSYLKIHAQKTDIILIMSNGGFDGIYQKLLSALE